jgi:hypothetical protein
MEGGGKMSRAISAISAIMLMCLVLNANADSGIIGLTWDNEEPGIATSAYEPGLGDFWVSPIQAAYPFNNGGDGPEIIAGTDVDAPTSGNVLATDGGGKDEGYYVHLNPAIAPGDLTVEYIFKVRSFNPAGNTAGLEYLGATEWPGGQSFQWMLRIDPGTSFNNRLCFWTNRGDSNNEYVASLNPLELDKWYHVAAVLDYNESAPASSQVLMYLAEVGQPMALQGTSPYNASANSFRLGCSGSGSNWPVPAGEHLFAIGYSSAVYAGMSDHRGFDGYIDQLAISDEVLGPGGFVLPISYEPSLAVEDSHWSIYY